MALKRQSGALPDDADPAQAPTNLGARHLSNPTLIELTRGGLVESRHAGALAIVRPNGEAVIAIGDIARRVFPRSAIKALQAMPLIETGAADRYGFGAAEIALACASHSGTPRHAEVAAGMLARAGLSAEVLGCGAHAPLHEDSAFQLRAGGASPSSLHNNCSGKHAGMLATAAHMGEPPADYWQPGHPVQVRVAKVLAEMTGADIGTEWIGVDGCSVPNWAIPLRALAQAFARLGSGEGTSRDRANTARRIMAACWAEPLLMAGPDRLDSRILADLEGRFFLKTGAEGVYCAAVPERGLGIALKIDDGGKRAAEAVMAGIADRFRPGSIGIQNWSDITNWRGTVVGEMRPSGLLLRELYRLGQ